METARRLQKTSEYYFSRKLEEIRQMSATGTPVINLGIGNPDFPPPPQVVHRLTEIAVQPGVHGYQSYKGLPALREAYAGWYERFYGVSLDPSREIVPLVGSKEGIFYLSMAYLNPGDRVLVPDVGYPAYRAVTEMVEAVAVNYEISEATGWYPDFDALEKTDLSGVKMMWVNYPNMPSGRPATTELLEQLVTFGKKHGILICHDNPYSFILNDRPLSILAIPGAKETAVELNSLSKTYNMAGWRMGMLAGAEDLVQPAFTVLSNVESGIYKPLQLAAVEAVKTPREWLEQQNRNYEQRRVIVYHLLDTLGCRYEEGAQGLFVWAATPGGEDAFDFIDRILLEARVFITPGGIFGENGRNYVRVSLCEEERVLEEAFNRIKQNLKY
jgi:aspartate/methionine/tyrosine aminotransferase